MSDHDARARQLGLAIPPLARDPAATLIEGPSNAAARAALAAPEDWPGGVLALIGPANSGKSHLAAIWAEARGAARARASDPPAPGPALIEDIDRNLDERGLLARLDETREGRAGPLLLTARQPPERWPAGLADLRSRFNAISTVRVDDPSDEEIAALVEKLICDRGADADPALIGYVVRRIERSYAAAVAVVEALDARALARKARITRALAVGLLGGEDVAGAETESGESGSDGDGGDQRDPEDPGREDGGDGEASA